MQLQHRFLIGKLFTHRHGNTAGAGQCLNLVAGAQQIRRVVPGVHIAQLAAGQVQHAVEHGDKHHLLVFSRQQLVEPADTGAGGRHKRRGGFEQRACDGHEQCGGNAFAGHIGHHHAQVLIVQHEIVVEVASHLACRCDVAMHLKARVFGHLLGQDAALHFGSDLQLLLQARQPGFGDQCFAQFHHHAGQALVLIDDAPREV